MPHTSPSLSPHELPILRVRFRTPNGDVRHSTITSDWLQSAGFTSGYFTGSCDQAVQFRLGISSAIYELCQAIGCDFLSLDVVLSELEEINPTGPKAAPSLENML